MYGRTNRPSLSQYDFALRDSVPNDIPNRSRSNSRFLEIGPSFQSLQQTSGDSSSSEDNITSKPKPLSKHSRSMSHPFPSLFSSKRKKNVEADNEFGQDDHIDNRDDSHKPYSSTSQAATSSRIPPATPDFATGNCMTCANLVRWPKELQVFRCTKCLTINDLRPFSTTPRSTIRVVPRDNSPARSSGTSPPGVSANLRPSLNPTFPT
jgi:E3 ubiquitin-protein ligase HECTD2